MTNDEKKLSVISLNCWGLFMVSKQREFRLQAIGDALLLQNVDIIALQEVWMKKDFEYIKSRLSKTLPFSCYFQSGTLGSGLSIFSKFPILSSFYLKFTLAGRPLKVLEGDFYVGKGCGSICIEHPEIGFIDVYTTHLQACYGNKDEYEAQRITECWQIANQVRSSIAQGKQVILAGDFNSIPSSYCYKILTQHGCMTDSWNEMHKDELEDNLKLFENNELSLSKCIECFGITCDSPLNSWTKHFLKQQAHQKEIGDRLDYIFYYNNDGFICENSFVTFRDPIPETNMSFSDHFGVHSIFHVSLSPIRQQETKLTLTDLKEMIQVLNHDYQRSVKNTKLLLILFVTCIVVTLALLISIGFTRNIIASILIALAVCLCSIFGVICLIVGFVFGKMEQRTLAQFITDMTNCTNNVK